MHETDIIAAEKIVEIPLQIFIHNESAHAFIARIPNADALSELPVEFYAAHINHVEHFGRIFKQIDQLIVDRAANRTGRVDAQILQCMFTGMKNSYSNSSWWNRICDRDWDDYHHPFNIAYRACFQWDSFSDMGRVFHFNSNALIQHLKGMTLQTVSVETGLNSARIPWCEAANNEMLIESSLELIDLSIRAIAEAISDGERYVEQNLSDFESSSIPFLTTDYNLDTGLPSAYNNEILGNYRGENRFTFKTDLLRENYDWTYTLPALD